jgi:penicillin amidase
MSRIGGLFTNLESELLMAQQVRAVGVTTTKALVDLEPGNPDLVVARGVNLNSIPDDVLKYYLAARTSVKFTSEDIIVPEARAAQSIEQFHSLATVTSDVVRLSNEGSNNWVLHGAKTRTGHPIMANDPHRAITAPSLRYWAHLVAPGWNVIGGGEPHLPGISIGHNEHGAWGLTIFSTDSEDLYVYKTNPTNPRQYRYKGKWEEMVVVRETFSVKGQESVTVELKYTRHGPVLAEDHTRHRAYALRAAWLEIGTTPYLASLRMDQATNWQEFREACFYSQAPSENMVWADVKGNIGWQATGIVPRRPNWNGLLPVPGDGRFEWQGYLPGAAFPFRVNPPERFLATANAENLPPRYPHTISYLWEPPYRQMRVEEVLKAGTGLTLDDIARLQTDELSIPARILVPLLRGLRSDKTDVQAALEKLLSWDYVLSQHSVEAGIYAAWQQRLWENFRNQRIPALAQKHFLEIAPQRLLASLTTPDTNYGPDPQAGRDRFLLDSLTQAVQQLTERFGADPSKWTYGQERYHHITLRHPMSEAVNAQHRAQFNIGPLPRGGDGFTVNNTDNNAAQGSGASLRIIADLADWDRSLGINAPGQSGNPADPHYRDLTELWATGKYFPLFYSREKIVSAAEQTLVLQP